jgi:diguanylate cyclase (GGDEF)-like protein
MLAEAGVGGVCTAATPERAMAMLGIPRIGPDTVPVELVVLDIEAGDGDAVATCRMIKAAPRHEETPVIVVGARDDVATLEAAFRIGASDFVERPVKPVELVARVRSALALKRVLDDRRARAAALERRERDLIEMTRLLEDKNERLRHMSTLDALTGIFNRRRVMEFLDQEWRRGVRDGAWLSLLMIDVDHFKAFNDTLGHQAGDDCLWLVANCLKRCLKRAADLVGRYGGEEFVVALPETPVDGAAIVAEAMRDSIRRLSIVHPDSPTAATVTASIGVAGCIPDSGLSVAKLILYADRALYEAKRQGRDRTVVGRPGGRARRASPDVSAEDAQEQSRHASAIAPDGTQRRTGARRPARAD